LQSLGVGIGIYRQVLALNTGQVSSPEYSNNLLNICVISSTILSSLIGRSIMSANPVGERSYSVRYPSDFLLSLRFVVGWTYFSAFWRRLILENKLLPDTPGYIGEKFNHFLPNALLIKPAIEYFVLHPELLWWKLVAFTIVEALVGLALMMGLFTRAMGVATSLLALGILLGAGWLGTTCLDEWQIGILGVATGMVFAFAGGGSFSIDYWLERRWGAPSSKFWTWARGVQALAFPRNFIVVTGFVILGLTLFTNQVFHGGVWGKLHNKSVRPLVEISEVRLEDDSLHMQLYRIEGADVYGSFAVGVQVLDDHDRIVAEWTAEDLSQLPAEAITNKYVAKVKSGSRSLVLPLGAKAQLTLSHKELSALGAGSYHVKLLDVSGLEWSAPLQIGG
jgi:thiosulfate dehydrogenase [quinone] large subunit